MECQRGSQRKREKQSAYWAHLDWLLAQAKKRWEIKRELAYLRLLEARTPQKMDTRVYTERGVS